jgi:serine/threonine protein kinase/Tol biopolymer transport system component
MPVTAGTRLGPYEIVSLIGAGGMGEVYKARDTRLDRSVAIKVLPHSFADNAQLKLRFEREAKTISQLTHPSICTLYDVGNEGGVEYLVMELLEGETLGDKLARGPLPMRDVLRYGREIAAALDRAHRAGVVHRDLKPGNVMITKSGAKLLDFGLAKGGSIQISPDGVTQQKSLTQEGMILGTFQYMAPEQLEGVEADPRTDIFALGAVLYEMSTGRRAFDGKTKTSLIAAIVGSEPTPIREVQPLTPPAFEHVVTKCLAKDPDHRWQSASDVASELEWIGGATSADQSAVQVSRRNGRRVALIVALVLAIIAAAVATSMLLRKPAAETPMVLSLAMPQHRPFDAFGQATLSPDGSMIVFVANMVGPTLSANVAPSLWLRPIDRNEPRPLAGTQGAGEPFWSPDGTSIGFFAGGKLKRIAVNGGPAQVICDAPVPHGGSWSREGVILFCGDDNGPLSRVDARGGTPRALTRVTTKEEAHRWPVFLPDGDHFIFLGDAPLTADHHLKVGSLRDGSTHDLIQAVTNAQYVEPGQLLYVRAGALLAQAFDTKTLTLSGEPRVIAEDVVENDGNHHFEFSATNGRLVYRSGSSDSQLTWLDRSGKPIAKIGEPRRIGYVLRISPDQQHVIAEQNDADGRSDDVWIFDTARGVATRFTFDPASDLAPVWSADGAKVAFSSMRTGIGDLYVTETATPANAKKLGTSPGDLFEPTDWSRDGELVFADDYRKTDVDILTFSTRTGEAKPYVSTRFRETSAALSPDNAFIAYVSDESGRNEVYVEQFPTHARRRQISTAGGQIPRWRGDGRELFYVALGGDMMSVDMGSETATPKPLFHLPGFTYDVTRDGQRFVVDQPVDNTTNTPLTFVSNWVALRK